MAALKGTKTHDNLKAAFAGESQANRRYLYFAKQADIERLFAETKKAFDKLDILVNNAGIYEFAPLENVTAEHFHKQFNLNVLGLLLTTQEDIVKLNLA